MSNNLEIMKKIKVRVQTVHWTNLLYDVPDGKTPEEFIEELSEMGIHVVDEEEYGFGYGQKEGLMLVLKFYLNEDDTEPYKTDFLHSAGLVCLDMLIHDSERAYYALLRLKEQAEYDGTIMADEIVRMNHNLSYKLTVNELLDLVMYEVIAL